MASTKPDLRAPDRPPPIISSPPHPPVRRPLPSSSARWHWEDVTHVFREAREHMAVGELVHGDAFNLHTAMSAIELMDPKMDIGFDQKRDAAEVPLPPRLSDMQLLNVLDHLLAAEMSWLDAHTLPQSVFACVYAQRLEEVPRFELVLFLRVLMGTMESIINIIADEKVADEEDFMPSTYGFQLRPLLRDGVEDDYAVLEGVIRELNVKAPGESERERALTEAIALRVKIQVEFYRVVHCLSSASVNGTEDYASSLLEGLGIMVSNWESCPFRNNVDAELIARVFDASINRHLMTSSPPRTAPLFDLDGACQYFRRILTEFADLVRLEGLTLPSTCEGTEDNKGAHERHSLHVAIHSVISFAAKLNPSVLTRALLSRIMIPDYSSALFANENADFTGLLSTDMGLTRGMLDTDRIAELRTARQGILKLFDCLCRNRSRQRRRLLRVVRWWDHYGLMARGEPVSNGEAIDEGILSEENGGVSRNASGNGGEERSESHKDEQASADLHSGKTALQVIACEVSARLMVQHWLLGFECDLYHEYEYAAVFFYVGYVLTTMANATTSLANRAEKGASLHPLRFALYTMDEARLWMCRAMFSALEALSKCEHWNYTCMRNSGPVGVRSDMFGNEELWYEQRFGVVSGLSAGPLYADYSAYRSFRQVQEATLLKRSDGTDVIALLLKDAAKSFLTARRTLEKAKKVAEACRPNKISEEILQLARVAVENSLTISRAIQNYEASRVAPDSAQKHSVEFKFSRHRHFPTINITKA